MQERRLAAIMFTDIVGYTALMGSDEDQAFEVLKKNREIHARLIEQFNGALIKEMGDGMLISFSLASDAVNCAKEIQKECKREGIPLKIGIHEGEMVFEGNDVLGDGVNIASRIQDNTEAGCITISASVYRDIKNKAEIKTESIGEKAFKNVDEPIRVYKVFSEEHPGGESLPENLKNHPDLRKSRTVPPFVHRRNGIIALVIVVVVLLIYPKIFRNDKFEGIRDEDGRISVAVMPFKNMTGDSTYYMWQEGLQNLLITSLSNSEELAVRQYETMFGILGNGKDINYSSITPSLEREVAKKLEANTFIVGNLHQYGDNLRITVNIMDADSEEIYKSFEMDGTTEDDFFNLTDSLSRLIRNFLEIKSLKQNLSFDVSNVYTNSSEAYKLYLQGYNCRSRLDYDCAVDFYNRALEIDSNFVSAMMRLAYCYGDLEQTEMSKFWAYKASGRIDQLPLDIQLLVKEVKAVVDKEPLKLIKHMKQYLEINPHSMRKHYGIGWVYFNTEQWQEAIEEFEKTLEISSRYEIKTWAWTYILLGRAYHNIREHKKEKEIFEDALGLLPDEEFQFTYWQAVCPLSRGDTTEANKYLNKGIGIGKQNGWPESKILSWLASIHDQANNIIKAEELYRSAFILNPQDNNLVNDFAYFLLSKDINIQEGFGLISRVLESKPDNGNYLHTYGLGLYKIGKLKEAQEALNKSWDLISYYDHDHFTHIQEVEYALASQNH